MKKSLLMSPSVEKLIELVNETITKTDRKKAVEIHFWSGEDDRRGPFEAVRWTFREDKNSKIELVMFEEEENVLVEWETLYVTEEEGKKKLYGEAGISRITRRDGSIPKIDIETMKSAVRRATKL